MQLRLYDERGGNRAGCRPPDVQTLVDEAKAHGYRAMQFNFVVSSNERAIRLWESLGFEIVGRLPLAFRHPTLGYVDALVMFQPL